MKVKVLQFLRKIGIYKGSITYKMTVNVGKIGVLDGSSI